MDQNREMGDLMQSIAEKSLRILSEFKQRPAELSTMIRGFIELTHDFQNMSLSLLKNPQQLWQSQLSYWQDAMLLSQQHCHAWMKGTSLPLQDKRFNSDEWIQNPYFNLLGQHYLLASEHVNALLQQLESDDKHVARRMQFLMRQYLDALSPANFLQTNPQLIAETLQSNGKNLLQGLNNLLSDVENNNLIIKMTDTKAFTVGKNLAITPGKVIFRNELMELIQYTPQTSKVREVPLLIIPSWINKYYILDLSPENSLTDWLVKQGFTVFMISWVNPDARYAQKSLFNYLNEGPLTATAVIQEQLQVSKINALGFCIGGTLLACMLAYSKQHCNQAVKSATFLASLLDFSDPGDISVFINEQQIDRIEQEMQAKGFLPSRFMADTFNSLRANDLIWSVFVKNYLQGKTPVPFDLLFWNADATNMPAKMHSEYLRWMYLQNDLIKPGKIKLNNTPLDINKITIPSFFVSTKKDHIAPWQSTWCGFQRLQGKKRFLLGESGHIAGIINPPDHTKYGFYRNNNKAKTSQEWLENAESVSGSWWPEWMEWLLKLSGKEIKAPSFKNLPWKPLMDAPGSYVFINHKEQ